MAGILDSLTIAKTGPKQKPHAGTDAPVVVEGLEVYGALAKIASEIDKGHLKTSPIKDAVMEHFIADGSALGRAPNTSYAGKEGNATASLQVRKRTNTQPLSPDVVARCNDLGIRTEHVVQVPYAVIVNPEHMPNEAALEKLLAMVKKAGLPADFLQLQQEKSHEITTDDTLYDIFALVKSEKINEIVARELVESVCISPVIVSKWTGSLAEALTIVREELLGEAPATTDAKPAKPTVLKPVKSDSLMDVLKASLAAENAAAAPPKAKKRA